MSFGFGSRIWTPSTKEDVNMKEKKSAISRIQKLKKRLNCGFGRLSISKEEIIPEFDHENDNVEVTRMTMNGELMRPSPSVPLYRSAPAVDNARMHHMQEPNGNIFDDFSQPPPPPPRTSSSYSNLDKCYKKSNTVNRPWGGNNWTRDEYEDDEVETQKSDLAPQSNGNPGDPWPPRKPPRPNSEFFGQSTNEAPAMRSSRYSGLPSLEGNLSFGKTEAYVKLEQLGEGSYATVYKGFSNLTNKVVAMKEIRLQSEEGTPFTAIREASLLRGLKHANIVTLHDIIHTRETLTFVFEYVHTDLSQYLERHPGGLNPKNVKLFLFQLLRGLSFCHERRVLHRDLKPQNLLISELGELKLADFGLARAKSVPSRTYSHEVVTLWYRPPDVLLGSTDYSTSLDMWGVGCIFVEMVTGAAAFPGVKDTSDQLDKIWRVLGTPSEHTWEGVSRLPNFRPDKFFPHQPQTLSSAFSRLTEIPFAESLATRFLQVQPERRISASDALHNQYFVDLPSKIYDLPHQASIFNVAGCKISAETHNYPLSVIKAAAKLRR